MILSFGCILSTAADCSEATRDSERNSIKTIPAANGRRPTVGNHDMERRPTGPFRHSALSRALARTRSLSTAVQAYRLSVAITFVTKRLFEHVLAMSLSVCVYTLILS